jgi:hypothetical protein
MANGRCRCGAEIAGEARFCGACGAPAAAETAGTDAACADTAGSNGAGLTAATVRALAGRGGDYYARKLGELYPSGTPSLKLSWNWAAVLVPCWYLYRRLYLAWAGFIAAGFVLGHIHPVLCWLVPIGEGALGNALYLMSLERRARERAATTAIRTT